MIALSVTMTTSEGWVVGAAFIVVGMLLQLFISLELDDRRDAREQQSEADRDAVLDATSEKSSPRIPEQRRGGSWVAPRGGYPEGGAR